MRTHTNQTPLSFLGHLDKLRGKDSAWVLLFLAGLVLWTAGCATANVNPAQARAKRGYVDFYAQPAGEYCWQVDSYDDSAQKFKTLFAELDPPSSGVLRCEFAPGPHQLQVTILNRVVAKPAEIHVEVLDGKVTPVRVTLAESGTAYVETKDVNRGGASSGRFGQRVKVGSSEADLHEISAVAEPPVIYQPKERMPFAH